MFKKALCNGSTLKHTKKAQCIVYNGLFSFFLFASSSQATPVPDHPILLTLPQVGGSHAFARQAPTIPLQKITTYNTISLQALTTDEAINQAVSETLSATKQMPDGKKAILNVDLDFLKITQSSVIASNTTTMAPLLVNTDNGKILPDQGIWLDQGIHIVQQRITDFFQKYQNAGGELDVVSLNYSGLTLSASDIKITGEQTGSLSDYLQAIEDDSRFADIATILGFSDLHTMYDDSTQASSKQTQWNAVMKDRIADYLNRAFYQPIASIFPATRLSANSYYTDTNEKIVGNHQSRIISTDVNDENISINGQNYPLNNFTIFQREINHLRQIALANNAAIHPEFRSKTQPENNLLSQSDLYQEMVFHTGLLGVRDFLFNNDNGTAADNQLLNDTLLELDQQLGNTAYQSVINRTLDWQQPYVLSSVEQGDQRIWRFTPKTANNDNASSHIVNYSPAQVIINGQTLTFPNADLQSLDNSISNAGTWIIQNKKIGSVSSSGCEQPTRGQSCIEYFANNNLSDHPTLFIEAATDHKEILATGIELINKDWGLTGTDFATGINHFSVRYRETQSFLAGEYEFSINADDAVKVWVDDQLIIDGWNNTNTTQVKRTLTTQTKLNAGEHTIKVEYADYADEATLNLSTKQLSCTAEIGQTCLSLLGQDSNLNLTNTHFIQSTNGIKFDFNNFEFPANVSADDNLLLKWDGIFEFEDADYVFNISHGKGKLRFWIDDELVYKIDSNTSNQLKKQLKHMSQGTHRIRVEQQVVQGAQLDMNWGKSTGGCAIIPEDEFCTEFFAGIELAGEAIHQRTDAKINFYWKNGSPEKEIVPSNRFSARWQGYFNFEAGDYRFISSTDDGIRVWVDGKEIISSWKNQGTTEYFADLNLSKGKHLVKVEYYENYGWATAKLKWEKSADCTGIPENQFCGSYFNQNKSFNGEADRTYLSDKINIDLQRGEKPLHGIRDYRYSVRWQGKFDFPKTGQYQFNSNADDGLRIWIDDQLVTDTWKRPWPFRGKDQRVVEISKGQHVVKVEYHQAWGKAKAIIDWQYLENCNGDVIKDAFCMELYENRQLNKLKGVQQLPKYIKKVDNIDFDWKRGAPEKLIASNNFSARWTGQHNFEQGNYRFKLSSDDGMRLFVDGKLIIDQWRYRAETTNEAVIKLDKGYHTVKLEYFEGWGDAAAHLNWQQIPSCNDTPEGQLCAEYFANRSLEGTPVDVQYVNAIDFDWGKNAPTPHVSRDKFSIRWTGNINFDDGLYRFRTDNIDDGMRILVDDEMILDVWKRKRPWYGNQRTLKTLSAGKHKLVVEYREDRGNARAKATWEKAPDCDNNIPNGEFCASFYAGTQLEASKRLDTRLDSNINYDWGRGSPHPNVPRDRFSTRWIGNFDLAEGEYTFNVRTDDGFRLKVANQTLIDSWKGQAPTAYQKRVFLEKGNYKIIAEYYEYGGGATAQLNWTVAPSQATHLAVISATPNSIILGWNAARGNATKYEVWRDQNKIAEVTQTSFADTQLASFQQYAYHIVAVDATGNRSRISNPITAFTKDGTAPSAPTGLSSKSLSDGSVQLTWQASSDNIGVSTYQIIRDQNRMGSSNNTSYIDRTADENTTYSYQIIALDNAGNTSAPSTAITVLSGDLTAPSAVNNLSAISTDDKVLLRWDKAIDNTGITRYRVIRDGRLIALSNLTSYTDSNIEKGVIYRYTIKALDASGNVSLASNAVDSGIGALCESSSDYFTTTVESSLAICSSCHIASGAAQNTRLVFSQGNDASSRNLSTLNSLTMALGKTSILNKVSGQSAHGGSTLFANDSIEYQQLSTLLTQLEDPENCSTDKPIDTESSIPAVSLAANCSSCHGPEGASNGPATPTISGLESSYLLKVLRDYQTNNRASTVMQRIAKGYSDSQLQTIANYFADQPHYVAEQTVDLTLVSQGKALHDSACASCHSNNGKDSTLTGTRLAGQWQVYTQRTLEDYIAGRSSAPQRMLDNIKTLHQQDSQAMTALASFYASIKADTEVPSTPDEIEVAATTADSITLTWFDADDDWSVEYYEIYRDGVLIGTTEFSVFTDTGLTAGNYEYRIVAIDSAGNRSEQSLILNSTLSSDELATDGAQRLDYTATLRKASLILLGRLPTKAELTESATEESFKATLRTMLDSEKALNNFVYRAAHETFLSNGAARAGSGEGIRTEDFPMLENLSRDERRLVDNTIKKEPVYLLQHIVDTDRPWTESLTADYTVLNGTLAKTLGATPLSGSFSDPMDSNERLPVRIAKLSARLGDKTFPHAGVLTTNAWLSRFPTTDTNRNRHRAAQVYQQFFGIDIEALAERPIDDSTSSNYLVPTMENPNCMVCHTIMEPVAGAFQHWGNRNRYAQNFNGSRGDRDSLSRAYKSRSYALNHQNKRWHQRGDTWYRDMLKPGFADQQIPTDSNSLQWLGQSLARDPRFAKGTVYFWYKALFKRQPLNAPLDTNAVDYNQRLAAFNEQDAIFDQLASRLVQNRGHGAWNIKDLLIDMISTALFRANSKTDQVGIGSDLGLARLLTPEELNRKLKAITGDDWRNFRDDRVWRDRMGLFYGGFDGGNFQPTPNSKMNSLMSQIPERMAVEMSCTIVHNEFRKGSDERRLFQFVETLDTPAFEHVEIANNNLLLNAGAEQGLTNWIIETGTARVLSGPRGCQGGPSIKSGEKIFNPGSICENQTELGRLYQQVDVTPWADTIDTGDVEALFGAALRGWSRNNDEASVYLTFHHANGDEISRSPSLLGSYEWKSTYDYVAIPAQTRVIRFHIQGRRISRHINNDSFADDTYLRIIPANTKTQTLGEQHIRATLQFLHQQLLGETLAVDSDEIERSYRLFKEVWADTSSSSSDNNSCRLYRDWEDPTRTKRAWSIVLMYLITDAKFLHE